MGSGITQAPTWAAGGQGPGGCWVGCWGLWWSGAASQGSGSRGYMGTGCFPEAPWRRVFTFHDSLGTTCRTRMRRAAFWFCLRYLPGASGGAGGLTLAFSFTLLEHPARAPWSSGLTTGHGLGPGTFPPSVGDDLAGEGM